jgi:hypothetical protein
MYSTSDSFKSIIKSDKRTFALRVTLNSSTELTGTTIQDVTLDEVINSAETLTMGCACSNKVTINLINPPTDIDYENMTIKVEVGLMIEDRPITYEWIPLGVFYNPTPETNNDFKNLKLTAYDGFSKMTGNYNATVGSTTTLQALYDDIKGQLYSEFGVVLKSRVCPNYSITNFPYIENITYIQAIGYLAGCLGGMARFDRLGELEIVWYEDFGEQIDRSMQYMNGFVRKLGKDLTVTSISTGTKDNPIVLGNGANGLNVNFENPYITTAMATDIFNKVQNLVYTPSQVKWRGNPAIQTGDIVTVLDKDGTEHTVLVMGRVLKIGGGLNDTIECKGTTETTAQFSNNFQTTAQKIERMYTAFEQAIIEATNKITGNSGGYVEIKDTNNDGKPDEILIMNTEDISTATQVWRWNKSGLGYAENASGNAYAGPYRTAITADGKINADFIATGTLKLGGLNNASGRFELYGNSSDLICSMDNEGLVVYSTNGNYVKLNAEKGLVGYDRNGNEVYLADGNVFKMENAEVKNEIKIAGRIKIVPVTTSTNVGIGFVALV